ncbi:MAG: SgcJ/EcaC family oxidoreductase [Acidobacteria bacterium]|nr:MAG: SgcJ/EcaC family oxidoreductase [Acidobacteriota bacterium]
MMSSEEIARVNRRFEEAAAKGDIEGMAAIYTEDGVALPPDGPVVKGHEALRGLWGSVVNDMGLKAVKLETVDLELISDDAACEIGEATLDFAPAGGEATQMVAKFIVVWKKVDGQWLMHRDIWNAKG